MQSTKNYDYQRQTTAKAKKTKQTKNETKLKAEEKNRAHSKEWRGMLHLDLSVIFIITNFSRQYIKHTRACIQTYIYIWKKYVCK